MEVVLHKIHARHLIVVWRARIDYRLNLGCTLAPCCAVIPFVVETSLLAHLHFEAGIRFKPLLVLGHPFHDALITHDLITANSVKNTVHQLSLLLQNTRIINFPIAI